jgi:hypothetical protein
VSGLLLRHCSTKDEQQRVRLVQRMLDSCSTSSRCAIFFVRTPAGVDRLALPHDVLCRMPTPKSLPGTSLGTLYLWARVLSSRNTVGRYLRKSEIEHQSWRVRERREAARWIIVSALLGVEAERPTYMTASSITWRKNLCAVHFVRTTWFDLDDNTHLHSALASQTRRVNARSYAIDAAHPAHIPLTRKPCIVWFSD